MHIKTKLNSLLTSPVFISLLLVLTMNNCVGTQQHSSAAERQTSQSVTKAAPAAPAAPAALPAPALEAADALPAAKAAPAAPATPTEEGTSLKEKISNLKKFKALFQKTRVAV